PRGSGAAPPHIARRPPRSAPPRPRGRRRGGAGRRPMPEGRWGRAMRPLSCGVLRGRRCQATTAMVAVRVSVEVPEVAQEIASVGARDTTVPVANSGPPAEANCHASAYGVPVAPHVTLLTPGETEKAMPPEPVTASGPV